MLSAVEGRIRVRYPLWRKSDRLERAVNRLQGLEGVTSVAPNAQAGSILIHYDPAQVELKQMKARVLGVVNTRNIKPSSGPIVVDGHLSDVSLTGTINMGMLASLGLAFTGSRRLHRRAGKVFIWFVAAHLFIYRKKLIKDAKKLLP